MKSQTKKTDEKGSKESLLEAGINLFAEKGYASTSVREIVERAGVSKPVLYYYFKNKEGLFYHILDCASEAQEDMLGQVMTMSGTVMDRLTNLCQGTYRIVEENRNLFKMLHNLVLGPPQGAPLFDFDQYHRRMIQVVQAIYIEGMDRNEVVKADPEEVAFIVLSLIDFCFHLENLKPEFIDPERPRRLLELTFQGLLPRSGRP